MVSSSRGLRGDWMVVSLTGSMNVAWAICWPRIGTPLQWMGES